MKNYYEYDPDLPLPYAWGWPRGVPQDYNALVKSHAGFIEKILQRYNKVERNAEDLSQGVWQRLLEANLLKKFTEGAARRLPLTMNSMQACWFLGVTPRQWGTFLRSHPLAATVQPCSGGRFEHHAVWPTSFICECDYEGVFKGKQKNRFRPDVSSCGFKTYLQTAIHNAFANLCRTKSRRHKEQVLPPTTVINVQSDGSYRQSGDIEDFTSWEAHITAAMTDEEALLDLLDDLRRTGIDFDSDEGVEILDYLIHQGQSSDDGPRRNVELLGFLGQGYTLEESVFRVQQRVKLLRLRAAS
jgi:hypothetical protein